MSVVPETPVPSRRPLKVGLAAAVIALTVVGGGAGRAAAHTESEYAAVPAGDEITVNFAPTHGCSGSPTTSVSVRVPAPGATAGDADGFASSAEADGDRTILRWTGGLLPADQEGEFPITFTVPDAVGELLLFPTVQTCEVGEVAWIDGDPEGEHPAVRMLVLAAGSEPAHTIDDVPADAPGRELLGAIVDVDNPATGGTTVAPDTTAPTATTAAEPTTSAVTTAPSVTTSSAATADPTAAPTTDDAATTTTAVTTDSDDDDSNAAAIVVVAVVLAIGLGAAAVLLRRRRV
jgi:periplasmic copper chaperone A